MAKALTGKIIQQTIEGRGCPCLLCTGEAPQKGKKLKFTADNGATYEGKITDVIDAGGELLIEFSEGLTPVKRA